MRIHALQREVSATQTTEILKALADDTRVRMACLLARRTLCVCELESILDMSQPNVSRHLTKMRQAGIVTCSRDAQWIHYRLADAFRREHAVLVQWLGEAAVREERCRLDGETLQWYAESGMNCEQLSAAAAARQIRRLVKGQEEPT